MRYNHDKDNLIGTYVCDLSLILSRRLAYEMVNHKLYVIEKFILIRRSQNGIKNINVIMNEFYDYGRAKCLNILVHNKLICLYGSKVANCHFQY